MDSQDLELLKRTRGTLQRIMSAGMNGDGQRAAELAFALNREVHERINEVEMGREQAAVSDLDLSILPPARDVDLFERGED